MKSNQVVSYQWNGKDLIMTVTGKLPVRLEFDKLSQDAKDGMLLNGIKQRMADVLAVSKTSKAKADFGRIKSDAEMANERQERLLDLVEHYNAGGGYERVGRSTTPSLSTAGVDELLAALAMRGVDVTKFAKPGTVIEDDEETSEPDADPEEVV